jgi:hypothetical protein
MDQRHVAALSLLCRDVARSAILAFVIENDVMIFNWFTPAPPVEVREKAWIEVRLRWLADQFGIDRLTKAELVLPSADWLSDAEDESPDSGSGLPLHAHRSVAAAIGRPRRSRNARRGKHR